MEKEYNRSISQYSREYKSFMQKYHAARNNKNAMYEGLHEKTHC